MKRIISYVVCLFFLCSLCSLFYGCENSRNDSLIPNNALPSVKNERITQFMTEHPYFNPYNTFTSCDGEYIYSVQKASNGITGGIYRRDINGSEWELIYEGYPDSVAVSDDYIYFTSDISIYRMDKSGSNPIDISFYVHVIDIAPMTVRMVGENIFVGTNNGWYDVSDQTVLNFGLKAYDCNEFINEIISPKEIFYMKYRRPWCELLPPEWELSSTHSIYNDDVFVYDFPLREYIFEEYPNSVMLYNFTDEAGERRSYASNDINAYIFIDYHTQSLFNIILNDSYKGDGCCYDVHVIGMDGVEVSYCDLELPGFEQVRWFNVNNGWLYGCKPGKQLVAYNYETQKTILSQEQDIDDSIDVLFDLIYFKNSKGIVHVWNPIENVIKIIGA